MTKYEHIFLISSDRFLAGFFLNTYEKVIITTRCENIWGKTGRKEEQMRKEEKRCDIWEQINETKWEEMSKEMRWDEKNNKKETQKNRIREEERELDAESYNREK